MTSGSDEFLSIFEQPNHPAYDPNYEENTRTMMAEVAARETERVEVRKARAREASRQPARWPQLRPVPFDDIWRTMVGFTAKDAAYFLGVSPAVLRTMIDAGELHATKTSRGYKIMRTALQDLVRSCPQRFPKRRFDLDRN